MFSLGNAALELCEKGDHRRYSLLFSAHGRRGVRSYRFFNMGCGGS